MKFVNDFVELMVLLFPEKYLLKLLLLDACGMCIMYVHESGRYYRMFGLVSERRLHVHYLNALF